MHFRLMQHAQTDSYTLKLSKPLAKIEFFVS